MTEQPETPTNRYTIPVTSWPDFVAKLAKLNKRAKRLGCEPVTYEVVAEGWTIRSHTFKTEDGEYTKEYKVKTRTIDLFGSAPKLEGFRFIARIEYLSDGKSTLFHTVPGSTEKIDERFRTLKPWVCEHCNKVRTRRETFVVMKVETGAQTQVGRQCLADFTGINTPEAIAAKASWLSSFSDLREQCEGWFGAHFAQCLDTLHVLSLTSAYIEANGWTPKSAASETRSSTASQVSEHFWGEPTNAERKAALRQMSDKAASPEHQDRAERVMDWVKDELAQRARSDYEMNLVTLVAGDLMEQKHLGIVCSAVSAYQRATNQKVEYAKKLEELKSSQHIGEQGKRMRDLPVKVHQVRALEANQFGPRTMVKFLDTAGNLLTWFASGDRDLIPGTEALIDGTVKCFKEYRGVKETQLSRVVVKMAGVKA